MNVREVDEKLDLRGVLSPMSFVKTTLKPESMDTGRLLEIILDEGEPTQNIPESLRDEGHRIVAVKRENGCFRLTVLKG
ncbi:MAG: sulfurtransferase TusA family protein [Thermodesulfobacteriota bacterium]